MKFASLTLAVVGVTLAFSANATLVTVGSLTRDTTASTITDSLNHREWLGFDVTKGLTYVQTVAATGAGGTFAGYSIAHNADAQLFTNALQSGGVNPCTVSDSATCMTGNRNVEQLVGESYYNYPSAFGSTIDYDYAWFLSDNGTGQAVGYMEVFTDYQSPSSSRVNKVNEWDSISSANSYTGAANSIGWILYRDVTSNSVPEPGSLALVGLALAGIGGLRRRGASVQA